VGWRQLDPGELAARILTVRRMTAEHSTNPHCRLSMRDWRVLDAMRRTASFNQKQGL
jgi:hypothetical protein